MKTVFLFSGQGSQYRGMGQRLYEENEVFRDSLEQSEIIVQKHLNRSLIEELYKVKDSEFSDLLITHPAIVAVEIAMVSVLNTMGINPDYVSGNSLGEFAAGVSSGLWTIDAAVEAAVEQAKSVVRNCELGGMIALINQKKEELEPIIKKHNLFLASDNFPGHFTITGDLKNISSFQEEATLKKINFLRLPVNYPFHCDLINHAYFDFKYFLATTPDLSLPSYKYVSGIDGQVLQSVAKENFWQAISNYSNFSQMVKKLEQKHNNLYIDLGPMGTSATFVKYNLGKETNSKTFQIMTPFKKEVEQLKALQELLIRKD